MPDIEYTEEQIQQYYALYRAEKPRRRDWNNWCAERGIEGHLIPNPDSIPVE